MTAAEVAEEAARALTPEASHETSLLRSVHLFRELGDDQLKRLMALASRRRFRRNDLIVRQGDAPFAMHILTQGSAKVIVSRPNGKEAALATLGPGDCIGEMGLIDGKPHSATVRAATPCDAIRIESSSFQALMPARNTASFGILLGLTSRLRQADVNIESLALVDVYGRVAQALVARAAKEGDGLFIKGKIGRQDLARQVGTSREMVSRIMSDLLAKGFMTQVSEDTIQIHKSRLDKEL